MIFRRAPLAIFFAAMALAPGGLALAQPSAELGSDGEPALAVQPAPEPSAQPQSPAEEAALRQTRLDSLFARLVLPESETAERDQQEIWALWSQSGSPSMDLLLGRASKAMEDEDYDQAMRFLNDLVRLAPDFAEGWNKRATLYFLRAEFGKSVADIQRTLALEPRHFGAISGLGIILERLGDKTGAMKAYQRGLEINPHLPNAQEAIKRLAPDVEGRPL
ncbi:MAG TPA: hypothetical protein VLA52_14170 [Thermohalobaculum sp.]|nr:hypothetical protein [Thermohalobaculum sp.]